MKGKQMAMDSALADLDRYDLERERQQTDMLTRMLDEKYGRMDYRRIKDKSYPAGSVVIIAQNVFRNNHYTRHFYRTVLNYCRTYNDPRKAVFVEDTNEEFPERPPWAETVGHEGELKDIEWFPDHIHCSGIGRHTGFLLLQGDQGV